MEWPGFEEPLVLPARIVRRGGGVAGDAGAASGPGGGAADGAAAEPVRALTVAGSLQALWGLWARMPWLVSPAQAQEEEEPGRRLGPGGRELSAAEALRAARHDAAHQALKQLEPNNSQVTELTTPGGVPNEAQVEQLEAELARARERAAEKATPGRPASPEPGQAGGAEIDLPGLARWAVVAAGADAQRAGGVVSGGEADWRAGQGGQRGDSDGEAGGVQEA